MTEPAPGEDRHALRDGLTCLVTLALLVVAVALASALLGLLAWVARSP